MVERITDSFYSYNYDFYYHVAAESKKLLVEEKIHNICK